jgi:tRNA 2-thiouridine synthesizing protein A
MSATLDLRDVTCPLTWVKTKLALERMTAGEELVVLLGTEEARENVPRSAREAGHDVTTDGGAVRIVRR